ncbi:MAG TPA: beta-L-arabinofuranosidase domain-containing protein [Spirochaetia bacterium]|nr:beta-L-arabinofuranosidase domain-containing protein [Spirochaetia bacterium]
MTTIDTSGSRYARLRTLPAESVQFGSGFWSYFRETNKTNAIQYGYSKLVESGVLENFEIAAGRRTGEFRNMRFADSDLYKWIEAASYVLADRSARTEQHEDIRSKLESIFDLMEAAQRPDGYLNTYYQVKAGIEHRWTNLRENHELYCAGHLIQAGVAHHRSTRNERLLKIVRRVADNICEEFLLRRTEGIPGHPEIEMALAELYRETGEERYLQMAKAFVDRRGRGYLGGSDYLQDHVPLREATEVTGHAVRQLYLLAGAADIYLESGEQELLSAVRRLWDNMRLRKMSVTGGVGSRHEMEAFGEGFELPNDRPYNETCAQIASAMTSWRLALATGEAQFVDLMEWTLYNSVLSGVSLDGKSYFYPNPLMSRGGIKRSEWFACACCPPNVMRTLASIGGYFFTASDEGLQVHLYDSVSLDAEATVLKNAGRGERFRLTMETQYPWSGTVKITVTESPARPWTLSLRIPSWCSAPSIAVNGSAASETPVPGSYFKLNRHWKQGDTLLLDVPMTPTIHEAHPMVEAARGCVSLARGPLVYCLEGPDQPSDAQVHAMTIDTSAPLRTGVKPSLHDGCVTIEGQAVIVSDQGWGNQLYRPFSDAGHAASRKHQGTPTTFCAIPYFLWANRGKHEMTVWIPRAGG